MEVISWINTHGWLNQSRSVFANSAGWRARLLVTEGVVGGEVQEDPTPHTHTTTFPKGCHRKQIMHGSNRRGEKMVYRDLLGLIQIQNLWGLNSFSPSPTRQKPTSRFTCRQSNVFSACSSRHLARDDTGSNVPLQLWSNNANCWTAKTQVALRQAVLQSAVLMTK